MPLMLPVMVFATERFVVLAVVAKKLVVVALVPVAEPKLKVAKKGDELAINLEIVLPFE